MCSSDLEGELERHKINQYTHWLTVPLAALQAFGQLLVFQNSGVLSNVGLSGQQLLPTLAMVFSMTAGSIFLVWVGELITESGIGNGVSVLIFGGIVAGLPQLFGEAMLGFSTGSPAAIITFAALGLFLVAAIVFFQEAQRRIPVDRKSTRLNSSH